jgi:DNA-binding transcriptional ArsR family regulator
MNLTELKAIQLAEFFTALSDASRIRIIALLLEGEMSVSAMAKGLAMSESAVSHQLRGLRHMHLLRTRKSGRQVFYSLADDHVSRLFSLGLEHVHHG